MFVFQSKRITHLIRCYKNIKFIIKNIYKNLVNYTFNKIIYKGSGFVSHIRDYKLKYFLFHNPRIENEFYYLKQNWKSFKNYKSLKEK